MTKVFITSCETGPDAWTHQSELLRIAFPKADRDLQLVDTPASADLIFITDLRDRGDHYRNLREHPLVKKFPNRCFSVNEGDFPPRWLRGIHASAKKSSLNLRRFQSGSYFLYHHDFKNPYVREYAEGERTLPERNYLFSFMGRNCNALRSRLFQIAFLRKDILVQDTSNFKNFTHDSEGKEQAKLEYARVLAASKYALCPRGNGTSSIRLFEAMSLGIAPVIVSDLWLLPPGPRWTEFALFIPQSDIGDVEARITAHEHEWQERGRLARAAYETYFTGEAYVRFLVACALDIQRRSIIPESFLLRLWPATILALKTKHKLVGFGKRLIGK